MFGLASFHLPYWMDVAFFLTERLRAKFILDCDEKKVLGLLPQKAQTPKFN